MGVIFTKEISEIRLHELFESDEKCLEFLAEVKWENGFTCRKCGNRNYCQGKTPFSRRFTKCKAEESAIAGTFQSLCLASAIRRSTLFSKLYLLINSLINLSVAIDLFY